VFAAAGTGEAHRDAGSGEDSGVVVELPPGEGCEGDEEQDAEDGEEEEASGSFLSPARPGWGGAPTAIEVSATFIHFNILACSKERPL